ncbi:MAG TPA: nickel-dependent hydrogenase large subunit [Rhodocyclaceae bacterium]|nr:nickel-dependent hydrogenase large subunit [Rhodocyclaceae bacterium]
MTRLVVGPFNRVEGDLEVTLDVADGRVREARVNSPLYRGFEQILLGKAPLDALVLVPRICGICSVAQSSAAALALAAASGLAPPANGRLAANLVLGAENLADHVTHFYLFFMPDFARGEYADRLWYGDALARFKAGSGSGPRQMLPARAAFLGLMGVLAGKWPHTLALQPGGTTRPVLAAEVVQLYVRLREFRAFLETTLFGDGLEAVAALDSFAALMAWSQGGAAAASDFGRFLRIAGDLELWRLGRAADVFLSYGAYGLAEDGRRLFPAGVWDGGPSAFDDKDVAEDVSHAWLAGAEEPRHPLAESTLPEAEKEGAYSWCKAPRLGGRVAEVGALARQLVAGHPLARDLAARDGGNVFARVVMRLLEIARLLPVMEEWAKALEPGAPFCHHAAMPDEAEGVGLVEAARGSLGHWLRVRQGRIDNYQIIAPTTWNFSPRDGAGRPGALEQALAGLAVDDCRAPVAVQHIVRSFDPCMVCTVH